MGLKGDTHKEYVVKCAKAGQAFYILDEPNDVLYQVVECSPTSDPNEKPWDHAEYVVTVKGMTFEKDDMKAIIPKDISKRS